MPSTLSLILPWYRPVPPVPRCREGLPRCYHTYDGAARASVSASARPVRPVATEL